MQIYIMYTILPVTHHTKLRPALMLFKTNEHYCYAPCSSSAPLETRAIWKLLKYVFLASVNTNEVK